jgi:hypothetical protein
MADEQFYVEIVAYRPEEGKEGLSGVLERPMYSRYSNIQPTSYQIRRTESCIPARRRR